MLLSKFDLLRHSVCRATPAPYTWYHLCRVHGGRLVWPQTHRRSLMPEVTHEKAHHGYTVVPQLACTAETSDRPSSASRMRPANASACVTTRSTQPFTWDQALPLATPCCSLYAPSPPVLLRRSLRTLRYAPAPPTAPQPAPPAIETPQRKRLCTHKPVAAASPCRSRSELLPCMCSGTARLPRHKH